MMFGKQSLRRLYSFAESFKKVITFTRLHFPFRWSCNNRVWECNVDENESVLINKTLSQHHLRVKVQWFVDSFATISTLSTSPKVSIRINAASCIVAP